ncbi:hypothetical protein [Cupriavidus oxalaticus]|uniref:hypothetical protein n=1 Tax=Cupriavidus oxalaticus TaxID=96344 RepID=UPI00316D3B99
MSTRKLNVQTPGDAPATTDQGEAPELRTDGPTVAEYVTAGYRAENYPPQGYASRSTDEEIKAAIAAQTVGEGAATGDAPAGQADELAALRARIAQLEGQVKSKEDEAAERLKADEKAMAEADRMITRADRAKYLTMHSSEVDAKKLLAPVQCKDGWLAPDMSDRPARR